MALTAKVLTNALSATLDGYTDFTSSGFGTPDVAVVFVSGATADVNPSDNTNVSIGFWDGTNQLCNGIGATDNQATDNTSRTRKTDAIASLVIGGESLAAEYTISNITDGVRITLSYDNTGLQRRATVVLLKGVTNKQVGSITSGNTTSAQDITSIGFKPDLVFIASTNRTGVDESAHAVLSFGVVHNNSSDTVAQGCLSLAYLDATSTASVVNSSVNDDCGDRVYWNDGSTINRKTVFSAFDSSGFTITQTAATNTILDYLALELPDPDDAYVAIKDSKTSTGTQAYTGAGFTPILLGLFGNTDTSTNSASADPTGAMSYGWTDGTTQQSIIFGAQDNEGTSNCFGRYDASNVLNLRFDDDTVDAVAAYSSFDSDGWTLNYSDGSASARKMLAVAIGNSAGGTTTLVVADVSHAHNADAVALTQAHTLALADAAHGHAADNVVLSAGVTLDLADTAHAHGADNVALTQAHTLSLADALHAHGVDNIGLSQATILVVADGTHGHAADAIALVQAHVLTVADASHLHSVDALTLTQAHVLVVGESSHVHGVDNITLNLGLSLEVSEALHGHAVDVLDLTQANVLVVQETSHGHTVGVITLSEGLTLTLADALHAHSADGSLTLTQDYLLAVADALHAHAADGDLTLATQVTLIVSDALHAHYADVVRWVRPTTPDSRTVYIGASDRLIVIGTPDRTLVILGD